MDSKTIKTMFDYHYGMFERVWACAGQLTSAQFVAENGYSLGSVRNHLVHCMNVDDRWLARLQESMLPPVLDEATFPDTASIRPDWDAVRERVLAYVASLTQAELEASVSIAMAGRYSEPQHCRRWEALLHMVNHGTDHRAQILARLHELGAPTLEQDLMLYLWDRA